MVKTRMSVVDCARMAAEVNTLLAGSWVQNIYTTEEDPKTFLFKLTGRGDKYFLLLESGVRFHPTEFVREKSEMPTGFAMKLRKHVRGRRLEYCRQVGLDRVVDFAFGKGTQHHHVVLEMYAGGNVILTDENGIILTLLRPYTLEEESADSIRVAVGQKYPFDLAMEGPRALLFNKGSSSLEINPSDLEQFIRSYLKAVEEEEAKFENDDDDDEGEEEIAKPKKGPTTVKGVAPPPPQQKRKKKKDKKKRPAELEHRRELIQCLVSKGSPVQSFGPQLIEHCLCKAEMNPTERIMSSDYASKNAVALCTALDEAPRVLSMLNDETAAVPGYLVLTGGTDKFYEGFEPYKWEVPASSKQGELREFPSFHDAVDEFYAKIEAQKAEKSRLAAERANQNKIDNVRKQQAERVEQLKAAVSERDRAAQVLELNVDLVDKSMAAVNSLLASGMSWEDVDRVVKQEKRLGNPVAAIIANLKLAENKIVVALSSRSEADEEEEEEDEAQEEEEKKPGKQPPPHSKILVEVDLSLSAQANVSTMFADKKRAAQKAKVTIERATTVVEEMQSKLSQQDRKKSSGKQQGGGGVRAVRKPFWFEKFHWFLTSEGILVLGGKDAHQNELLFKKFLRKGDAYMHADIHGAPTVIVRNPFPKVQTARAIPSESMRQAGVFCVCKSPAWQAKIVTSAWWVESYQVSRTAPTGEFLPTGSFMIRGKKNYLQPTKLEMGFGYIFKLDLTAVDAIDLSASKDAATTEVSTTTSALPSAKEKEWRYLRGNIPPPAEFLVEDVASGNQQDSKEVYSLIDVGSAELQRQQQSRSASASAAGRSTQQQQKTNKRPGGEDVTKGIKASSSDTRPNTNIPASSTAKSSKKKSLKLKRAQAKYGDQTEEEKRLAMIALGHALPPVEGEEDDAEGADDGQGVEESVAEDEAEHQQQRSWLKTQNDSKMSAAPHLQQQQQPGQPKGQSKEEQTIDEEEQDEDDQDESEVPPPIIADDADEPDREEVLLKGFTANPEPGDVILYALPFSGPIDAMSHFKFRVKLTPGTLKKGKAAKQAVALFQSRCTDRERQVINSVTDPENVAVMMMDVKVSAPGLEKVRANIKDQQKKKKVELNSAKGAVTADVNREEAD